MKVQEKKSIRFRIYVVGAFFLLGLGVITARAYQLQVLEKDYLQSIADGRIIKTIDLPPERGNIYDRNGNELALSVEAGAVYAHPVRIKEADETAGVLAQILKQKKGRILRLLKSDRSFVWIKRGIASDQARQIKSRGLEGVVVVTEPRRYYPGREIASHLIGFVGDDYKGLEGLEKKYDDFLRGAQHRVTLMRDALGRPFSISNSVSTGRGRHDLILTIDKDIQYKAQQALKSAVDKSKARGGHCLVVDPETGEILAMAVMPEYNPNIFSKYRPNQWRNRAITDCFEPGSTIKTFLLAASLEEEVVTPNTRFDCENGKYKVGDHVIHDSHENGVLTVSDIIIQSSNIGAIKIGDKIGYETFYEYLRKFGFGGRADIDLLGERKGYIREIGNAKQIDKASLFFGQGMTITSLQLVMAMAAIANGGELMRPYVVKGIKDDSGHYVRKIRPEMVRKVISNRTAQKTARILEGVVGPEGTGEKAAIEGFRAAGKTGTSQKVDPKTRRYSRTKHMATFVGFVPANQPKLVILVVVDEPKGVSYGGLVSGPAFKEIGQWSLNYLRVNPQIRFAEKWMDTPENANSGSDSKKKVQIPLKIQDGLLPNFRGLGMREVIKKVRSLGLKVSLEGTGLAVKQYPKPGVPLGKVTGVKVRFNPPT